MVWFLCGLMCIVYIVIVMNRLLICRRNVLNFKNEKWGKNKIGEWDMFYVLIKLIGVKWIMINCVIIVRKIFWKNVFKVFFMIDWFCIFFVRWCDCIFFFIVVLDWLFLIREILFCWCFYFIIFNLYKIYY